MRMVPLFLLVAGCAAAQSPAPTPAPAPTTPVLVVMVTVDQMRPDYFARFGPRFTGGLKRLAEGGVLYTRGEQDHAITETAPGHATLLSGRSPGALNIVTNTLGVPDPDAPLLGITGAGASPKRFRGTTLYDWLLAQDPETRALSISRKDRGAILPLGRAKVPIFWYQGGIFTSSTWYFDELPAWVQAWNARKGAHRLAGQSWELSRPAETYPEPDAQPWERGGVRHTFPHRFSDDTVRAVQDILSSPYPDSLALDLALEGIRELRLGQRGRTDLLAISLSATDGVGHTFGPDSREIHDDLLRVDGWLGWFMDSLATMVPRERVLWVLSADHGVTPFPEAVRARGRLAGRANGDTIAVSVAAALEATHHGDFDVEFDSGLIFGDTTAIRAAGVDVDSLASAVASRLARLTGATRVHTPRLLRAAAPDDLDAQRWRRTVEPDFAWIAAASLAPNYQWGLSRASTTHGTTNADDVRVPILFMGPGITPGVYDRTRTAESTPPRTIDIAPTLAALLGVTPLEPLHGVVLPEVVKR